LNDNIFRIIDLDPGILFKLYDLIQHKTVSNMNKVNNYTLPEQFLLA